MKNLIANARSIDSASAQAQAVATAVATATISLGVVLALGLGTILLAFALTTAMAYSLYAINQDPSQFDLALAEAQIASSEEPAQLDYIFEAFTEPTSSFARNPYTSPKPSAFASFEAAIDSLWLPTTQPLAMAS